jgi:hypothetical protein
MSIPEPKTDLETELETASASAIKPAWKTVNKDELDSKIWNPELNKDEDLNSRRSVQDEKDRSEMVEKQNEIGERVLESEPSDPEIDILNLRVEQKTETKAWQSYLVFETLRLIFRKKRVSLLKKCLRILRIPSVLFSRQ